MHLSTLGVRRTLALVTIGVLIPIGLEAPAHAVVIAPSNLSPTGGVSSNTPTLSWSKVTGGAKYEVQVDNNDDFSSPAFSATTTNNRVVPDKVLPTGDISWRVRTLNASNAASSWSSASITISPLAPPAPVSPVGGASLPQPTAPPLLVWSGTQGATGYTVQIDETDDFISPLVSMDTQTTSVVAPNPLPAGEYFWHVKATKATGVDSAYSDPVNFFVSALQPVTIVAPNDNPDNQVEDVVLDWNAVAGAAYYQLQVATDTDFNTIVDDKATASSKIFGTRYSPPVTYDNNQYYWRVRAVDIAGNPTAWSPIQAQFNRVWPDKPTALYPVGDGSPMTHITGDPYFQWTPVQHASQYEIQYGSDANFSPGTFSQCQVAGTTYTFGNFKANTLTGSVSDSGNDACVLNPGAITYWRVRALDRPFSSPGVEGIYSDTQSFVYDGYGFSNLNPTNGEVVDIPTLSWDAVPGAVKYKLDIKNGFGQTVKSGITTYSTSYTVVNTPVLDPAKGPFHWWITAYDAKEDPITLIHENTFNVSGNPPADTPAAALTPLSGRSVDPPTSRAPALTWEPLTTADHYAIFVGPHGSGTWYTPVSQDALQKELPYPAVTDTWTWFLNPGQYDWYVQAYNSSDQPIGTGTMATFTISPLAAVQGRRIALDGMSLDANQTCTYAVGGNPDICTSVPSTPVFDWSPVPGAGMYILYVSEDASFTNLLEPVTAVAGTSSTRWAPTMSMVRSAFPDSQAGGAYWWFVRPCKTTTICGPNPVSTSGMATNKFRKQSPAVALVTPANGAQITTPDVTLDWDDYLTTNQATTWAITGEESPQAAQSYRVQVDNDATFTSPIESVVVDQSTYTSSANLYPEGELYWRVQAVDADDNSLSWSPTRTFTKSTPGIGLISPTGGAHVAGTTAFRWTPQAFVGSYQLEVYKNADTAASSTNKLFGITSLKQSAYVYNKPIPAAGTAYVWRVRRIDADSNPGPWSAWGSFFSTGSAPTLISPTAGSLQPANGPLFTWSEVAGATTYTLETRSTTSTTQLAGTPKTTPANAWAMLSAVPNGTWEWRVTAKDSGGAVLGTSAWRSFKVDGLAPKVVSKSPTTTAYRTANFKATFNEPVKGVSSSTMRIYRSGYATPLVAVVTLSADKKTATLNPSSNLRVGVYYVIKLSSGITDLAGNKLVATSWKVRAK